MIVFQGVLTAMLSMKQALKSAFFIEKNARLVRVYGYIDYINP